MFRLAEISSK